MRDGAERQLISTPLKAGGQLALPGQVSHFASPACREGKGFPGFSATDMWGQMSFRRGRHPVPYMVFSNIPGLYPLDTSSFSLPSVPQL